MLNKRVIAVLKRELRERIMTKSFIIATLSLPLIMALIMGLQYVMMSMDSDAGVKLAIVSSNNEIISKLKADPALNKWIKDGDYQIDFKKIEAEKFDSFIGSEKKNILDSKIDGILWIPDTSLKDKKVRYYAKGTKNLSIEGKLGYVLNQTFIDFYFKDKNVSKADLQFARMNVDFDTFKVTKDKGIKKESGGNIILAYLFSFMLYISLIMMGSWIMQSVLEEKANRICEVILSSVDSKELMTGKILGSSLTGLLQMFIWIVPIIAVVVLKLPVLPAGLNFEINLFQISYFLFNFFIGLVTFVGLFATVGAIFNNAQEAQTGVTPLMMLIIIPFLVTMSLMKNPSNMLALVTSMLPFFSIIVMPARMTLNAIPLWQLLVSFAVNIGTILLLFPAAGKIYKVGILRTGKKPGIKELYSWIKNS